MASPIEAVLREKVGRWAMAVLVWAVGASGVGVSVEPAAVERGR